MTPGEAGNAPPILHSLDHCVANGAAKRLLVAPCVDRTFDASDHYLIVTRIKELATLDPILLPPKLRFDRAGLRHIDPVAMLRDRRWEPLLRSRGFSVSKVFDTMMAVTKNAHLMKTLTPPGVKALDGSLRGLLRRRQSLFARYTALPLGTQRTLVFSQYSDIRKRCNDRTRAIRRRDFQAHMAVGVSFIQEGDFWGFWKWVRSILGEGRSLSSTQVSPVIGADGVLEVETDSVISVWHKHLESLYTYAPPTNLDRLWHQREATILQRPKLRNINTPISLVELGCCLARMAGGRCPGPDGFPAEWFKIIMNDPCFACTNSAPPAPTFFTQMILRTLNGIFSDGVPPTHNIAWVCAIPKGGPGLRDPGKT